MVEFLAADAGINRDPTLLDIYSRIKDPDRVDYVHEVIDATIAEFQASAPEEERLDALKSRLKYGFVMGLDTPGSTAGRLSVSWRLPAGWRMWRRFTGRTSRSRPTMCWRLPGTTWIPAGGRWRY